MQAIDFQKRIVSGRSRNRKDVEREVCQKAVQAYLDRGGVITKLPDEVVFTIDSSLFDDFVQL